MSRGLSCRFTLKNGRFLLTEGIEKSRDNIWFYCIFDKFRVYVSDFGGNFVSLLQKPVAYLQANSTIILGRLSNGISKYVGGVTIKDVDLGYLSNNRKEFRIRIEYTSVQDDKSEVQDVMFV